jgi:hypothetical protein
MSTSRDARGRPARDAVVVRRVGAGLRGLGSVSPPGAAPPSAAPPCDGTLARPTGGGAPFLP